MSLMKTLPLDAKQVIECFAEKKLWEDKYRQLITWGKLLPPLEAQKRLESALVSGCESKVWLIAEKSQGLWHFQIDSDARIIKGLIAILLAAFNHQTAETILEFDVTAYFNSLDLLSHLSHSRGNGLAAVVTEIKNSCR